MGKQVTVVDITHGYGSVPCGEQDERTPGYQINICQNGWRYISLPTLTHYDLIKLRDYIDTVIEEVNMKTADDSMVDSFNYTPRDYALQLIDEDKMEPDVLLSACLRYMSYADVQEMLDENEASPRFLFPKEDDA